jgi:hypothetical protein
MICSDGMVDINMDMPGLREVHAEGVIEVNPLFRNFEKNGMVSGYGISNPGKLYQQILAQRNGTPAVNELSTTAQDFYTTVIVEAAEKSLAEGKKLKTGATMGEAIDLEKFVRSQIGKGAKEYGGK